MTHSLSALAFAAAAAAAQAQPAEDDPPAPAPVEAVAADEILVVGIRQRGSAISDVPPEIVLDADDIAVTGAASFSELLGELGAFTRSGRGRGGEAPIVLLNGRRIAGFREIRAFPPEALERVEVLPEEAALAYGARPDQRVVNFILRQRFSALTTEARGSTPTRGGRPGGEASVNLLRLDGDRRVALEADVRREGRLLESQRDIAAAPGLVDQRAFRTLRPETSRVQLGGSVARPLSRTVAGTVSASFQRDGTDALLGLPLDAVGGALAADPLARATRSEQGALGLTLTGDDPRWRWTMTGNAGQDENRTVTDRAVGAAGSVAVLGEEARSRVRFADLDGTVNGRLFRLPAGAASGSLALGGETRAISSRRDAPGAAPLTTELGRDIARARLSVDLPIASPREDVLPRLGQLSANLNLGHERLSDFGGLMALGAGLNWAPAPPLRLVLSWTREDGAPSVQQLGNPLVTSPNVRLFDQRTGQTVEVTRLDGGNRALDADRRRALQARLTLTPLSNRDLTLTVNYVGETIEGAVRTLGSVAPALEDAFPERFERDAGGRLVAFDNRPFNIVRSDRQELRWGGSLFVRLAGPAARGAAGRPAGPDGGPGPRARGAGPRVPGAGGWGEGGMGGRAPGGGVQLALFHTVRLEDRVLLADGLRLLDLLEGGALGGRGGSARHEVEARAGITRRGLGARLTANWTSATLALADPFAGAPQQADLRFVPQTIAGLRLFADLGQQRPLVARVPFLANSRLTLDIDNLTDSRPLARDRAGATPLGLQPDLLDPLSRTVRLGFRKLFVPPARP